MNKKHPAGRATDNALILTLVLVLVPGLDMTNSLLEIIHV